MNNYAQISETLIDHPKVTLVMRRLKINRFQLVGHLATLWNWAMKNAPDGDLSRFSFRHISDAARFTDKDSFEDEEDVKADNFVSALIQCRTHECGTGFIESDSEGLRLHDWDEFGGRVDEKRNRNAFLAWLRRYNDKSGSPNTYPDNAENFRLWQEKLPPVASVATTPLPSKKVSPQRSDDIVTTSPQRSDVVVDLTEHNIAKHSVTEQSISKQSIAQQSIARADDTETPETADVSALPCLPDENMHAPDTPLSRTEREATAKAIVETRCKASPALWGVIQAAEDRAKSEHRRISMQWCWRQGVLEKYDEEQREKLSVIAVETPRRETSRPPVRPIPPDWLPGVPEKESRYLCNEATNHLKARGRPGPFTDDIICDEARRLWGMEHPNETPPWKLPNSVDGEESVRQAVGSLAERFKIPNRKIPGDDYSAPNNPGDGVRE